MVAEDALSSRGDPCSPAVTSRSLPCQFACVKKTSLIWVLSCVSEVGIAGNLSSNAHVAGLGNLVFSASDMRAPRDADTVSLLDPSGCTAVWHLQSDC